MSEKTIVNNNTTLASFSDAIVNLANKVAPSVIGIQSKTRGNGSGIVWSADGHIVTCSHVVKRLDEVEVVGLSDDKTFSAKVIGNDPYSDIALLKIEQTTTLKPIEFNETENLKAGQFVLALANPYGDHPSITEGIVTSSRSSIRGGLWWGREGGRSFMMDNVIITDARLNPGYSGGPLVDVQGNMIGLNIAYVSSRGIAIRISKMKSIVDKLSKDGRIKRAYLGVILNTISLPSDIVIQQQLNETHHQGLMVVSVENGTPAKKAGLLIGDVIVKFNKEPVNNVQDLNQLLTNEIIGKSIELSVLRGERLTEITIIPGEI